MFNWITLQFTSEFVFRELPRKSIYLITETQRLELQSLYGLNGRVQIRLGDLNKVRTYFLLYTPSSLTGRNSQFNLQVTQSSNHVLKSSFLKNANCMIALLSLRLGE